MPIFLAVLTPASVQSRWVRNETYVAIELESKGHVRFVPLDVERCDVPGLWSVYQRVSFLGGYADGLKSLLVDLEQTGQLPTEKPTASPEPPQVTGAADEKPATRKPALAPRLAAIFARLPHQRSLLIGAGAVVLVALVALAVVTAANKGLVYPVPTPTIEQPTTAPLPTMLPAAVSTRVSDKDGMVYVPAGEFLMGLTGSDSPVGPEEKPQHTVHLDAFWIDRTEVTNAMFTRFVTETRYKTLAEECGSGSVYTGKQWEEVKGADWRHPIGPSSNINGLDNYPVVQVSWRDAQAYCQWGGRQLPTEAQWEKAARGTDGRLYPWGNELATCDYAVMNDSSGPGCGKGNAAWPVGSKPRDSSPYGALDMSGNVTEWVADWYDQSYYASSPAKNPQGPSSGKNRVTRGGGWYYVWNASRAAQRSYSSPDSHSVTIGFRCVALP